MDDELRRVQRELKHLILPFDVPSAQGARTAQSVLLHQLSDYLLPRYQQWDAPLIAVVGGSTGAGKSTLVNSLVGEEVSAASAIRPTTRRPVLVHHPADEQWFTSGKVLPRWIRHSDGAGTVKDASLHLRASRNVPQGLAIIDAPDIDSLDETNRERSRELLSAADVWIFATTAMRYADAVPWDLLTQAHDRNVVLAIVLNRVPEVHIAEVERDLVSLLTKKGLGSTPVFVITEKSGTPMVEPELSELRDWLHGLLQAETRSEVIKQTLDGATAHALDQVAQIVSALEEQHATRLALSGMIEANYRVDPIMDALKGGELLRGEVLKQWHEFLGTGEFFRKLEAGVGRLRDRFLALWRKPAAGQLKDELGEGFAGLLLDTAAVAAQQAYTAWQAYPAGGELLEPSLAAPSADASMRAHEVVSAWQRHVLSLVRTHGDSKRTNARLAALGVNAVAVLLMILAFASTGGLLGAEVAIAGGSAVVAQRVLEAIFGEHGMRQLAAEAQADLLERATGFLDVESGRYYSRLPEVADPGPLERAREASVRALGLVA